MVTKTITLTLQRVVGMVFLAVLLAIVLAQVVRADVAWIHGLFWVGRAAPSSYLILGLDPAQFWLGASTIYTTTTGRLAIVAGTLFGLAVILTILLSLRGNVNFVTLIATLLTGIVGAIGLALIVNLVLSVSW